MKSPNLFKSLGFGIERIGLLPLLNPWVALLALLTFSAFCALGVAKLETDDALSDLFRSKSAVYQDYKVMSDLFPSSERDVLVVIEGNTLLSPKGLAAIRDVHQELEFVDSVDGALSIFSMRGSPNKDGYAPPIIPHDIPEWNEGFELVEKGIKEHPLVYGKMLSEPDKKGNQIALVVLSIRPEIKSSKDMTAAMNDVRAEAERAISKYKGLTVDVAGIPVMRQEIKQAIKRDRLIFNTIGFIVGFAISLAFFRRPTLVFIASVCPALSVLWSLGLLGHMGFQLNTFINVIPPLVMVIALSDAMHMVYSIRRNIAKGLDRFEAIKQAVMNVGPACVLTSLTTSLAMVSLAYTDSGLIRQFGFAAAIATLMAFVSVIFIVPTLTALLIRNEEKFRNEEHKHAKALNLLEVLSGKLGHWITPRHLAMTIIGISMAVLFSIMHTQLKAQYRLTDQVPTGKESVETSSRIDKFLEGATPLHILIEWPADKSIRRDPIVLNAIEEAHRIMEEQAGVANVWSVAALRRWLRENKGDESASPKSVGEYLDKMPEHLLNRFVNEPKNAAIITGRVPDIDAKDTLPILDGIEAELLQKLPKDHGMNIRVTGLSSVSAVQSSTMINQLNQGLLGAIVLVIILIGIAFRSREVALLSIVPNLLPIAAAGAGLYLRNLGLEYASVIGLTVAFGLAVDDSIHFLNRLHLERQRTNSQREAVSNTLIHIGPVLILTTMVLVCGLAVTILSELPSMRQFGSLAMTTLIAALVADLLILPAIIISTCQEKLGSKTAPSEALGSESGAKQTSQT